MQTYTAQLLIDEIPHRFLQCHVGVLQSLDHVVGHLAVGGIESLIELLGNFVLRVLVFYEVVEQGGDGQTNRVETSEEQHHGIGDHDGLQVALELLQVLALVHLLDTNINDVIPPRSSLTAVTVGSLDDV